MIKRSYHIQKPRTSYVITIKNGLSVRPINGDNEEIEKLINGEGEYFTAMFAGRIRKIYNDNITSIIKKETSYIYDNTNYLIVMGEYENNEN